MDGRAYLEKLISDRLREAREQPEHIRGAVTNLPEIRGIAAGLMAAGALTQDEAGLLLHDLRATMERAGWLTPVTVQAPGSTEAEMTTAAVRRSGEPAADRRPTGSPGLLRVVPLVGREIGHGDVVRKLISLEVWNAVLIVRSAVHRGTWEPGVSQRLTDSRWRWRAWDDQGTQYRSTGMSGGGSSGTGDLVFENRAFFPSPPDGAETLTLIVEHPDQQASVELPLR
ncbi:hypothetical protein [Kibdelosporangium phytohabitans]|uniref:Uncharacterized protein n=1 Tax=Kibdelosporangium phytohabitans TaxID=860235 RepID=A0A0N9I692_9PSEU|nr:hypothetical protein [Kibdelosporangium phytohabitans]ALG11200.1 hypothetical protein AOZ06_33815 [Kibdelosporangium phytohabitans]MBE1462464.1 hypothetical protein [Kibdelosporangium phytohabitans]